MNFKRLACSFGQAADQVFTFGRFRQKAVNIIKVDLQRDPDSVFQNRNFGEVSSSFRTIRWQQVGLRWHRVQEQKDGKNDQRFERHHERTLLCRPCSVLPDPNPRFSLKKEAQRPVPDGMPKGTGLFSGLIWVQTSPGMETLAP
ncbi:hypothetical protein [Ruegeria atlantica]|uniref:hypothetical protein n=1 Tax=Ruegeria atlantica TaxID=81569 RepID=UPI00164928F2|nr:hypothetical protein [Ruegeria atlantica]